MRRLAAAAVVLACALAAGCAGGEERPTEVVLVTHDSFALSAGVKAAFERESGLTLRVLQSGDAGEALNRALLTAGDPTGDVLFGVDDSLLSRALDGDLFVGHEAAGLDAVPEALRPPDDRVTPVDHGDVCLNVDRLWFAERGVEPPSTLEQLAESRYRGLLVVENPATSSPGLAFLLATIVRFGDDGWEAYWRRLRANDVLVADGWEEAYTQRFSGASGSTGTRPIVVSYATSPAAEVFFAGKPLAEAPTAVVEDGCFRQVEYAGILRGAPNEEGARELVDFLLSERFQRDVPLTMFVFPARGDVPLPEVFREHAVRPDAPLSLPPERIASGREGWIERWTDVVLR